MKKRNIWLRISLFGEKIFDARQIWQEEIFDGKYESIKVWLIPCQQKLRLSIGDGDGDWWWWSSSSAGSSSLCKNSPPWLRLWFFIAQPFSWSAAFQIICFLFPKKSLLMVKYPLLLAHDTKSCYRQRQPRIQTWSWPWRGSLDGKVDRFALNQNTNTRLSDSDTFISNINTRIWRWPAFFHTCIKEIIPLRPGRESLTREQAGVSPTLTKKTWRSRSPTIGIKSPANIIGINQSRTIGMG